MVQNKLGVAFAVLVCGTLSTAAYEQLNVRDRGCGDFITFCEYMLVVVLHGKYLFKEPRRVPVLTHLVVLSGYAFSLLPRPTKKTHSNLPPQILRLLASL